MLSLKIVPASAVILLGLALAACNSKSGPTKENFAQAVQAHFDGMETVCGLAGAVPFDAASFSHAVAMAEPLVKVGVLSKTPTTVRDAGEDHTLLPGFHYELTEEGKNAYRAASPASQSVMVRRQIEGRGHYRIDVSWAHA